jgi:hypothetical protein
MTIPPRSHSDICFSRSPETGTAGCRRRLEIRRETAIPDPPESGCGGHRDANQGLSGAIEGCGNPPGHPPGPKLTVQTRGQTA